MFKENAKKVETIIKTSEEPPQSSRLNGFQRLKECCFIVGVLSSVLLAVALFTFSPADPSWSQTAWGGGGRSIMLVAFSALGLRTHYSSHLALSLIPSLSC
ncbi:cell division protein FtsK [Vibrio sp. JCM 18905]|nr:cell division protein FtsK [Vibrio sp. JCM 18905]